MLVVVLVLAVQTVASQLRLDVDPDPFATETPSYYRDFADFLDNEAVVFGHDNSTSVLEFLGRYESETRSRMYRCIHINYKNAQDSRIWGNYQRVLSLDPKGSEISEYLSQHDHEKLLVKEMQKLRKELDERGKPKWREMLKVASDSGIYSAFRSAVHVVAKRSKCQSSETIKYIMRSLDAIPSPDSHSDIALWTSLFILLEKPAKINEFMYIRFLENPMARSVWIEPDWLEYARRISERSLTLSKPCRDLFVNQSHHYRSFHIVLDYMKPEDQIELVDEILQHMIETMVIAVTPEPDMNYIQSVYDAMFRFNLIEPILERLLKVDLILRKPVMGIVFTIICRLMDFTDPQLEPVLQSPVMDDIAQLIAAVKPSIIVDPEPLVAVLPPAEDDDNRSLCYRDRIIVEPAVQMATIRDRVPATQGPVRPDSVRAAEDIRMLLRQKGLQAPPEKRPPEPAPVSVRERTAPRCGECARNPEPEHGVSQQRSPEVDETELAEQPPSMEQQPTSKQNDNVTNHHEPESNLQPSSNMLENVESRRFQLIFMIVAGSTVIGSIALFLAKAKFQQDPTNDDTNDRHLRHHHHNFIHTDTARPFTPG